MAFYKFTNYTELFSNIDVVHSEIKGYILDMKARHLSTSTINNNFSALKIFYEMNDFDNIKWNKLRRFRGEEPESNEDRAYRHEEILKMMSFADLRLKATILLLSSTGMRIGAPGSLQLKHLQKVDSLYKIRVYPGTRDKYFSFCTPECARAIDQYLQFRERVGEKLTPESPLFRTEFDIEFIEAACKHVKPCSTTTLRRDIDRNNIRAGIKIVDRISPPGKNRKEVQSSHGFRKFFKSQLTLAKVDPDLRELLLGHSKKKLELVYTRLSEQEILQEYYKAIDFLTINPENRLMRKVVELSEKQDEITLMKLKHEREMEKMDQKLNKIMSIFQQNPKLVNVKPESLKKKL